MDPIAIIGCAVRLPSGIESTEDFWDVICHARQLRSKIPENRLNADAFYHPNSERTDTTNVRHGHFLAGDMAAFDAQFFSLQPIEAESMDPQQRLLMETSYRALENAGLPLESVAGSQTSVYIAQGNHDYEAMLYRDPELTPKYMGTGVHGSFLANRLSWFYGFRGPSATVDTACSGSLTALHLACQSLRNGEASMAMAGGGSLILHPELSMNQLSTLGFLSPDGISYSFDSRANGYAKGEGMGIVILKRLSDAIRDNDTIRSVIRATSLNQDGRTPGITQPSGKAQAENIRQAYRFGDLSMDKTCYFEAHGTGTPVGDPIEARAIYEAFRRGPENPLWVGSVKANIGHLEAGAGVAGLIKSTLVLEKGMIAPNAAYAKTNPDIPAEEWGLRFATQAVNLSSNDVRRASINSFGFGGTNGHAIIDDAASFLRARRLPGKHDTTLSTDELAMLSVDSAHEIVQYSNGHKNGNTNGHSNGRSADHQTMSLACKPKIFVWSAADSKGIERTGEAFAAYFKRLLVASPVPKKDFLHQLSYTLSKRRSQLPWKSFAIAATIHELHDKLVSNVGLSKPTRSSVSPSISFVFTGQGAQWYAMGRGLATYAVFADSVQRSAECLRKIGCAWDLQAELNKDKDLSRVDEPELSQPLCTVLQIALVQLLRSWDIKPVAVTGHSSGEIAAAYCAGALSHESAVQVAFHRGVLASKLRASGGRKGAMLAVALSEERIGPFMTNMSECTDGILSIGCVNAPDNVTVTGDEEAIDALERRMIDAKVFARKLQTGVAYHSQHMQQVADEYRGRIDSIIADNDSLSNTESVRVFSSVTGDSMDAGELSRPDYWVMNLVGQVKFASSLQNMAKYLIEERREGRSNKSGRDMLVEIGPHAALQRPVKDTIKSMTGAKNFEYEPILIRDKPQLTSLLGAIASMYCQGCSIDLTLINSPDFGRANFQTLTDLPVYRFNHSQTYWVESQLSRNFRFRQHKRHELLGLRDVDWNAMRPKWRNVIRSAEHPWIQDHKFEGTCLYPAAGALVMALEGARQLVDDIGSISGYQFENVSFVNGFLVPDGIETVEGQLLFLPRENEAAKIPATFDFTVHARSNERWIEVCRGTVTAVSKTEDGSDMNYGLNRLERYKLSKLLDDAYGNDWESVNSQQFYSSLKEMGYDLGPCFQTLKLLKFTETGQAKAEISLNEWIEKRKSSFDTPHVMHPTDLDAIFQLTVAAYSNGSRRTIPVLIPTKMKSLWISESLFLKGPGESLRALTEMSFHGYREAEFSIGAVSPAGEVQVVVSGFRQTAVELKRMDELGGQSKRLCYGVDWKPDFDLLPDESITEICNTGALPLDDPLTRLIDRTELISHFFMGRALQEFSGKDLTMLPSHIQKYYHWMQYRYDADLVQRLREADGVNEDLFGSDEQREDFLTRSAQEFPECEIHVAVAKHLSKILHGVKDPLDLLFADDLASRFYAHAFIPRFERTVLPFVDLIAHNNHSLEILEIGAGTGSTTVPLLKQLTRYADDGGESENIARFKHYTFTDISPAFFNEARDRFAKYSDSMSYKVLNVEADMREQGFGDQQYDLIVCGAVLHATSNIRETLRNVRRLLKTGGRLIVLEPSNPTSARTSFVFGLLSGWWLSVEKERTWSPLIDGEAWCRLLEEIGFENPHFIPDHVDPLRQTFGGLIATAAQAVSPCLSESIHIVINKQSGFQSALAQNINHVLGDQVSQFNVIDYEDHGIQNLEGGHCIVLVETESSFFEDIDEDHWAAYKAMLNNASGITWVTRGNGGDEVHPNRAIVTGLGRNVHSEKLGAHFVELALDARTGVDHASSQIIKVFLKGQRNNTPTLEPEYREISNVLCTPRLRESGKLDIKVHNDTQTRRPVKQPFNADSNRALTLTIAAPGLLDTLQFDDDAEYVKALGSTEVEVEVHASGVNFKDVLIAIGQIPASHLGFECSGVITRVGSQSGYRVGERVACNTITGSFKTFVRTDSSAVIRIPYSFSWEVAAALPIVFSTAYYSLVTLADIQEGESILIHSAAGGVGQAAIQIAQRRGAEIFATAGSPAKRELLRARYGIADDHIFNSRSTLFAEEIMVKTHGNGVDVVLNSLSGQALLASWSCIAPLGRFIELGRKDIDAGKASGLPLAPFGSNVTFSSVNLEVVMQKSKKITKRVMDGVAQMLNDIKNPIQAPYPVHEFKMSEIENAFRFFSGGQHSGKVVVTVDKNDIVPVLPSIRPTYTFPADATYIIAGGLGGLGRTLVEWMSSRGARNFLLLSRSGGSSNPKSQLLISRMSQLGVRIEAPACDITSLSQLTTLISTLTPSLPPIRGCIQACMVLQDGLLENTSATRLHAVLRPKTTGTLNLAHVLPHDLDFFVLFSSIASITGSRGQANYSAANTYQDALARKLTSEGCRCISLNLGSIMQVGFAAEHDLTAALRRDGFEGISKAELLSLLDYVCNPNCPEATDPERCQIVTGLAGAETLPKEHFSGVYWTAKPMLQPLIRLNEEKSKAKSGGGGAKGTQVVDYAAELSTVGEDKVAATEVVTRALVDRFAKLLAVEKEDVDVRNPILAFGIDSLIALELRYWLAREFKVEVSVFEILNAAGLEHLASTTVEKRRGEKK